MPDDPANPSPTDRPWGPDLEAEVRALVDRLLDDVIDPGQVQRLEALVVGHRPAAVLYYELVHLWCILPLHLSRGVIDLGEGGGPAGLAAATLDESMILPAIRAAGAAGAAAGRGAVGAASVGAVAPPSSPPDPSPAAGRSRPPGAPAKWWGGAAAAAAVLMVGGGLEWHRWHRPAGPAVVVAPSPAVVTATAGAVFEAGGPLAPGARLAGGDPVRLTDGAVELTFASGAVVVVRGPARVRLVDGNRLALDAGAVAARVPPAAHGFRVDAPGSAVVDVGTEFGVRTAAGSGASEVDVFVGAVDVAPVDAAGRPAGEAIRVGADHAVQMRVDNPMPVAVTFAPAAFDREIAAVRVPVPSFHGTGVGVAPGAPDPAWQVAAVPDDPAWQPRPAVVVSHPWHTYAPNAPDGLWVSLSDPQREIANGEYVLRTTADLTAFDPATVSVRARVAADNQVLDVRVNGVSTGATTAAMKADDDFGGYVLTLPAAPWHAGPNRIDVVLQNSAFDQSDKPSFAGLQVAWTASASPLVRR